VSSDALLAAPAPAGVHAPSGASRSFVVQSLQRQGTLPARWEPAVMQTMHTMSMTLGGAISTDDTRATQRDFQPLPLEAPPSEPAPRPPTPTTTPAPTRGPTPTPAPAPSPRPDQPTPATPPAAPPSAPSFDAISALLGELGTSVDDVAAIERASEDPLAAPSLALLTPEQYGELLGAVKSGFEQPRAAALLARPLGTRFTAAHVIAALHAKGVDPEQRVALVQATAHRCSDLVDAGAPDAFATALSAWEAMQCREALKPPRTSPMPAVAVASPPRAQRV